MPKYSVDVDVLRHALFEHVLAEVGESLLHAKVTSPVRVGALAFSPTGELSVRVLNDAWEKDEDAVFAGGANPHIAFEMQSAWIRYKLSVKADAGVKLPMAAAKGSTDVALSDYRIHAATDGAWTAMKDDLDDPRTILDLADVRRLQPGEALAMELGGTLSASVTFSWADAISSRLAELLDGLPAHRPVVMKLESGLQTKASVKIKDHFSIVLSRAQDGTFRIAVKKARSQDHSFGIEVSLGAEVDAIPGISKALEPLFEAITGVALDAAERAAAKLGVGELTTAEEEVVQKLAESLGIDEASERDAAVREAIDSLRKKLLKRLARVARWKAATGFAYEYARIEENSAIADFLVHNDALLDGDYALAIAGDFDGLADALRHDRGGRTLVKYLNESELTCRSSGGFSLGLGKWIVVKAHEESTFRQTTRRSLDGQQLITSRGTRRYEENGVAENDFEWIVDLKAQMKEFSADPSSDSFDYGLHYQVTLDRDALQEADLDRMLDFAAMWGVRTPDASAAADAVGRKATMRLQLVFDRDELESALRRIPASLDRSWAAPLAAAMPYMSSFPERRSFAMRGAVYELAWAAWLRGDRLSSSEWVSLVTPQIRSGLALVEERHLPGSFVWTSGEGHAHLRDAVVSFIRGAQRLHQAMTTAQPPQTIGDAYAALQRLWTNRLSVAASGRYLLDRARHAGVNVSRSLQIEYDDTTIVI